MDRVFRPFPVILALAGLGAACGQPAGPGGGKGSRADAAAEPPSPDAAPRADQASPDRAATPAADAGATDLPPPADAGGKPASDAAGGPPADAGTSGPATVLLFHRATGYVHESKGAAARALERALGPHGVTATISEDPALVTAEKLATFGAVVLIDTTGTPFGDPGTAAIEALGAFVRGGRGLVGVHAASNGYETTPAYVNLIGGDFTEHPGGVRMGRCAPEGMHPAVARLPATFALVDEFYMFRMFRADNIVDLRCDALSGGEKLPIAWHRAEGQGRVFFTALGHNADEWNDRRIVEDHVVPGILWSMGR
jgi:type 1 glutamine amidotransferase